MLRLVADSTNPSSVATRLRRRRWDLFVALCRPDPRQPLLDVGGVSGDTFSRWWSGPLVRVNVDRRAARGDHARVVVADARHLPFRGAAFEVAFSNSLIEHVGGWADQQLAAREIRRVSKRYFVETPDRHCPIEPHYLLPLFQYLPERAQRALHHLLPIGWIARGRFERVWLLTARELQALFPGARIMRERFLALPKACYAVGPAGALTAPSPAPSEPR